MNRFVFAADTEEATDRLGAALADLLPDGTTVALCGTLGAGKTRLVQAIAAAAGIPRGAVTSPTFVLCQEYHGRRTLYHLDAYRVRDEDEFLELGPDEYFESAGVTLVEWADRVVACLPRKRIDVCVSVTGAAARRFEITAQGARYHPVVDALAARMLAV